MAPLGHDVEMFTTDVLGNDRCGQVLEVADRKIDCASAYIVQDLALQPLSQMDLHPRVLMAVAHQVGGQGWMGERHDAADQHLRMSFSLQRAHTVDAELQIVEDASCERREWMPGSRQGELPGRADEQLDAEQVLDPLDRARQ